MRKKKLPSKKTVRETLLQSLFDPRDASPMSIVVSMDDPAFAESKAIELIHEGKQCARLGTMDQYNEKIAQAISLLALARVQRGPVQS